MIVKTFYFNPYRECTYVTYNERAHACAGEEPTPCLIIDCGAYETREQERLAGYIRETNLKPVAHLITHAHPDHICGAAFIEETYGLSPIIYPTEGQLSIGAVDSSSASGTTPSAAGATPIITVLRTPGHKEDCVCYYIPEEHMIFTGDTLFQESIGRTDLPGGDYTQLMHSLEKLKALPDETTVYPGHGYATTIAHEKKYNPYL